MSQSSIEDIFRKSSSSVEDAVVSTSDISIEAIKTTNGIQALTACDSTSHLFNISKILKSIDVSIKKNLHQFVFREHLVISDYEPHTGMLSLSGARLARQVICAPDLKAVGGIVIDTQLVGPTHHDFLIFVSSQLTYKGRNGGSHITSCVSSNLHTIEEKRVEFINIGMNLVNEKHLYTALQNTGYYMASRSRLETTLSNSWYSFEKTENLILEGANFILMRFLAVAKYIGSFEMVTLYINGDLCRNIYVCDGPQSAIINNTRCDVVKIQRIIVEKCGIEHNCIVTLLVTGQIVKQEWHNCSYVLHLNPLIDMEKQSPCQYTRFPTFYEWEKDLQLFSKYLDFKTKRLALYKNYYEDHPDIKDLIADYTQNLLLEKPEDVLDFTLKYFRRFSKDQLPYSTYFKKPNIS